MTKEATTKEQYSVETTKKEEEEPQLPVSDSPQSVRFHSLGGSFTSSDREIPHLTTPAVTVANNLTIHEAEHHYKVEEGIVSGENKSGFLMSKKEANLTKALLFTRIIALVLCMVCFALMADDRYKVVKLKGYEYFDDEYFPKESFYHYKEFKFELAVNVIGFIYSALQIGYLLNYIFTKKHLVNHKLLRHFTFAADQVLTYMLLSASVSAVTVARRIQTDNEIVGEFIDMANASIAFSFLAFKAFALASLISGYMLIKFN